MAELPIIFHNGKKNVIYQWRIWTEANEIVTEYGQIGGQLQIARKKAFGKNVGQSNETTDALQAELEAKSMWTFKRDRKYCLTIEECKQKKYTPMLAPGKDFKETKKYVSYPADVQPKLDGNRCLAYWEGDRIVLMSRGGKEWDLDHIKIQLALILPEDAMFDGELYLHGESCQTITSWVKKYRKGITETIQFHVYDIPIADGEQKPWSDRKVDLFRLIPDNDPTPGVGVRGAEGTPNIIRVPTFSVNSEDQVWAMQAKFLEAGFEGLMVRLLTYLYEWGYRSKGLLKVKNFDDHEFVIVGFVNGKGKNETTVKWLCKTAIGQEFGVAPTGVKKDREQMLRDGEQYIGKLLKVKHQGYSDDGIPRFPVGIGFRGPEDMSPNDALHSIGKIIPSSFLDLSEGGKPGDWPTKADEARMKEAGTYQGQIDRRTEVD